MSITSRITVALLLVFGLGVWWLVQQQKEDIHRFYRESTEEPLVDIAVLLSKEAAIDYPDIGRLGAIFNEAQLHRIDAQIYGLKKTTVDLRIYIVNRNGFVVLDSDGSRDVGKNYSLWNDVIDAMHGRIGSRTSQDDPAYPRESVLYVSSPIQKNGEILGSLTVAKPTHNSNQLIESARSTLQRYGAIMFCVIALVATLLMFYIARPLRKLTRYAEAIRDGKTENFPSLPQGEIFRLGTAFKEMQETLEGKKYIEQYVQTLTHEMKNPLTAIQGALEIIGEDITEEDRVRFIGTISRESERIKKLLNDLLTLSTIQNRKDRDLDQEFLFASILDEVLYDLNSLIQHKDIRIIKNIQENPKSRGEPFWIHRALSNIIQNAIEFSPPQGSVTIDLKIEGNFLVIAVSDQGSGIPDWAKDKIFERFFSLPRPHTKQKSTGLGLILASEITKMHQGFIAAENNEDGGARFTLSFSIA